MDRIKADLTQLDNLDIMKQGFALNTIPPRRAVSQTEKSILKPTIEFSQMLNPQNKLLMEPIQASEKPPTVTITPPKTVPIGLTPRPSGSDVTIAVGLSTSAFAVIGVTGQAGLYGSSVPELGLFGSAGVGWWSNVGYSIGPTISVIFGPPSDLAGVSWGIGIDVRIMVIGSAGGMLLFSPPPFRFIGFALSVSSGVTAIPALDVTLQVTDTIVKPLFK